MDGPMSKNVRCEYAADNKHYTTTFGHSTVNVRGRLLYKSAIYLQVCTTKMAQMPNK